MKALGVRMRTLISLIVYSVLLVMFIFVAFLTYAIFDDSVECGPGTVERENCVLGD